VRKEFTVFHKHADPDGGLPPRPGPAARLRAQLSFANMTAGLALFVALGGTAAVGSPEIKAEAVGSTEIQDNGVGLTDISASARNALQGAPGPAGSQGPAGPQGPADTTSVGLAEAAVVDVPRCDGIDLRICPSFASVAALPPGSWLVHAKFTVAGTPFNVDVGVDSCGLVQGPVSTAATVLDQDEALRDTAGRESTNVTLTDVVTTTDVTRIGLRCLEGSAARLTVSNMKLTALEVTNVVGP
jgi:hypothetical protein